MGLKKEGDAHFKGKRFAEASEAYGGAIASIEGADDKVKKKFVPWLAILLPVRARCLCKIGAWKECIDAVDAFEKLVAAADPLRGENEKKEKKEKKDKKGKRSRGVLLRGALKGCSWRPAGRV